MAGINVCIAMMDGSGAMGPTAMPNPSALPGTGHDLHDPMGSP